MIKPRPWSVLLVVVLSLALLRHVCLAWYVHPYADDFSYAVGGMRQPLLDRWVQEYTSWNGRYLSNILVLCNPLVLGMGKGLVVYRIVPIALILLTWYATFRFIRALVGPSFSGATIIVASLGLLLLFLHGMPDASEGIYWFSGAVTYQLPNALALLLITNWLTALRSGRALPSIAWWCVQVALVLVIAGCNELHMGYLILFHAGLLGWCSRCARREKRTAVILLGLSIVCGMIVALAPGNATRGANFPLRHDILLTLGYSMAQTVRFIGTWLLDPVLLVASALFLYWRRCTAQVQHFAPKLDRWVALVLPVAVVFVAMFVTYWPTGLLGQYRTLNAAWFFFLPAWFVMLAVWEPRLPVRFKPEILPRKFVHGLTLAAALLFFFSGRDRDLTNDLLSGRAARYDQAITERYRLIMSAVRSGGNHPLELPAMEPPRSLVILPLSTSPDHWMNRSMADYFGNAQLNVIAPPPPAPAE